MSQHGFTSLSASARSGGDLTAILEAIQSGHIGAARPTYATKGMIWAKDVDADTIEVYLFDGAADVLIGTVDVAAGTFTPAGSTAPTTSEVLTATASATEGAVGTYALLGMEDGSGNKSPGAVIAGSSLAFMSLANNGADVVRPVPGFPMPTVDGSWRLMGYLEDYGDRHNASLFLRIA